MKTEWKGSSDPHVESGVATLKFDSGNITLPLASFQEYYRLTSYIQHEINNAVWHGRERLKRDIEAIKS